MPLVPSVLEQSLLSMLQPPFSDAAEDWVSAIESYVATIAPPSTTQAAARAAFVSSFSVAPSPATLVTSLQAYAAALGGGMVPPGTPPPAPLSLATFLANPDRSYEEAASELAVLIDAWFRTGLTGTVPPIPWS